MKKTFLLFLLFLTFAIKAQERAKSPANDTLPVFFIGGGTGINNACGLLGIYTSFRASDNLYLRAGFGFGSWGRKFTGGFKYELKALNSWAFGLSYSSCSGKNNYKANLEVQDSVVKVKQVTLDLFRTSTINLTVSYKWVFQHKNIFFVDMGYSIPVEYEPYLVKDGSVLTRGGKTTLRNLQPGGVILGLGLLFGL
ncbi:MAG TPA: hypothetical protein VNY73_06520 [Bacteroidia bacterium]|nr:hypothetical protein [Bacteroidia bacterium]